MLMRHAKAEVEADLGDKLRPLATRGRRQSSSFGSELAEAAGPFDVALVSAALRTRETYRLLAGELPEYPTPRISDALYDTTPRTVLAILRAMDETARRVLVVGHEPVMSSLAHILHDDRGEFASQLAFGIPTSTAVVLDIPVPWSELDRQRGHVRAVMRPAE